MIADAVRQAQKMHRQAVEATYDGLCTVYEKQAVKDPVTKATSHEEAIVLESIPCHLSYSGSAATVSTETVAAATQTIKLFLAPEVLIKPGSKIVVSQQGITGIYCRSSQAPVYASHQEIMLELFRGYT